MKNKLFLHRIEGYFMTIIFHKLRFFGLIVVEGGHVVLFPMLELAIVGAARKVR